MSNLSDVHTVEELVEFISAFIETVPTQNDYDNLRNQMLIKRKNTKTQSLLEYQKV